MKSPISRLILGALAKTSSRNYSTKKIMSEELAHSKALVISEEFKSHEAMHHPLFQFLKEQTKAGLTPAQFQVYRDNFFYRTANTILSVAIHAQKAAEAGDYKTLAEVVRNLFDEGGHGDLERVHLSLLEKGHNIHGQHVFGIAPLNIIDAKKSPLLLPEAISFRQDQERLFKSSYPTMTGCLLAHEGAADDMLDNFRKTVFEPYRQHYTEEQYTKLIQYYTAHKDDTVEGGDVEKQHQEQALRIVTDMISNEKNAEKLILEGGKRFLVAQAKLWSGLLRDMEKSQNHGLPVPFTRKRPTPSPQPDSLGQFSSESERTL